MQYQTNYPYATSTQQCGALSHAREEQRRRQQEYSQALAQQVAQREQQKRRERELDQPYGRRNSGLPNPPQHHFRQEAFEPTERGMLGGLGHNNPQDTRQSFARGQPQLRHRLPGGPESFDYSAANTFMPTYNAPPVQHRPSVDNNQAFRNGFGVPQQPHPMPQQSWPPPQQQQQPLNNDPMSGMVGPPPFGPGSDMQMGWGAPTSHQNAMAPTRNSQFWAGPGTTEQAAPPAVYPNYGSPQRQHFQPGKPQEDPSRHPNAQNAGRRQRTDIHDGGRGDSEDAERLRRKQQQQLEMQLALERQIEEKRQQKLEAKRRQEEEDRRELERFEEEQRRQRAEQERLQEEKRRKAALEQQKADQAAAAVAAANAQAKRQQQQKLHAQLNQPQQVQPLQQQNLHPQHPELFPNASPLKNPLTNSRAHLFEDPPEPPQSPVAPNYSYGYSHQNASPIRGHPGQPFAQDNNAGHVLDPTELRRQYDDMRDELSRQRHLVDQLRQAQAQIQQQRSPVRVVSDNVPTLMDLEQLRNELRGELAYREQLHRQELESLKREQQQGDRLPERPPQRYPRVRNSLELPTRIPNRVERVSSHPVAIQGQEESIWQRGFPVRRPQPLRSSIKELDHRHGMPLDESVMSLRGESKFVYFDDGQDGEALEEHSDSTKVKAPLLSQKTIQKSVQFSPTRKASVKQSVAVTRSVSPRRSAQSEASDTDSDDEDRGFVVAGITSSPSHQQLTSSPTSHRARSAASSHRYSQLPPALASSSSLKSSNKWRLESMGANDSDEDLDQSLDGDQLEALFQRNVRRHEILLGFQSKFQGQPQCSKQLKDNRSPHAKLAWAALHQQLESNRRKSTLSQRRKLSAASNESNQEQTFDDEAALVASSTWMPPPNQRTRAINR
ncbi:hypothetical protein GN958_ATG11076 [Phytophthora infestans]|uniref:Uncharacterized protein n=1 Tax=Phytophthora infestans TaxID=4787 RepID=A0A8S9UFL7_PHYIN|nr:hypothetical protein GN958_ATG11076 [Phytophthora infestans]